jgi:hypothetical protein
MILIKSSESSEIDESDPLSLMSLESYSVITYTNDIATPGLLREIVYDLSTWTLRCHLHTLQKLLFWVHSTCHWDHRQVLGASCRCYQFCVSWFSFALWFLWVSGFFWVWGPHKLLMESHPHMCFLMLLRKLCEGSPQFQSNPTLAGRDLSKMLPLTIHGDGTPVCGAGKSWSKMGDFFSWSCMLMTSGHSQLSRFLIFMVHAYMRCPNLMS